MAARLHVIERAVLAAGRHVVEFARGDKKVDVRVKADSTLVLNLDIECQAIILERLSGSLPIVAEEDEASHSLIESEGDYLLVDPIDGTTSCKRFLTTVGGQIGFGPLVGMVKQGRLLVAAFYNITQRALFTAVRGEGCWMVELDPAKDPPPLSDRQWLSIVDPPQLFEMALLFYPGTRGEVPVVESLRSKGLIENVYRFGGFANDCSRLARGFEQIQIQFAVKPWDLPAILFPLCAGLEIRFDPLGSCQRLEDWSMAHNNPVIVAPPASMPRLIEECREVLAARRD